MSDSDLNKDGVTDIAEAVVGGEEHMAAQKEHVDEVAAREAARRADLTPAERLGHDVNDLHSVGFAPPTEMTSPGGPWHGLPPEAATDPNHPDWAENCRWACVQGSFFACTYDGSTSIGEHAENIRGYGIPTEEGQIFMRSISTLEWFAQVSKCIEAGNDIVYNGVNVSFTKA
jgi:hypothetical protein